MKANIIRYKPVQKSSKDALPISEWSRSGDSETLLVVTGTEPARAGGSIPPNKIEGFVLLAPDLFNSLPVWAWMQSAHKKEAPRRGASLVK